ncbi:methyltransferase domain-containing protein [Streptomyces sp. NPDC096012]|uniref:class I SAM-dependent methyltransferase n=1 Tax=Streptomyces sp. NPDC096012 TaxID=3155684 RepID=UPI00336AC113
MSSPPTARIAWAAADPYATALRSGRGPLFLRRADGWLLPLEVERWCARADAIDREVLDRCEGAVLDVGCGPGRLVAELAARGRTVLGIDVSDAAVEHTARRLGSALFEPVRQGEGGDGQALRPSVFEPLPGEGRFEPVRQGGDGQALRRSVFEPLPGEGCWDTVLLMDGNIGIGGDPAALLERVTGLLRPGGLLIAETVRGDVDERARVQVVDVVDAPRGTGVPFLWARLGTAALLRYASRAGLRAVAQWETGDRCFAALRARSARSASRSAEPPKSTAVISSQRARKPSGGNVVADR